MYHGKELLSSIRLSGHTIRFHPQTQELEQLVQHVINSITGKYCTVAFI